MFTLIASYVLVVPTRLPRTGEYWPLPGIMPG